MSERKLVSIEKERPFLFDTGPQSEKLVNLKPCQRIVYTFLFLSGWFCHGVNSGKKDEHIFFVKCSDVACA